MHRDILVWIWMGYLSGKNDKHIWSEDQIWIIDHVSFKASVFELNALIL